MKQPRCFLFALLGVTLLMAACGGSSSPQDQKKGSSGKTLELMIAADSKVYSGSTLELIDSLFQQPQLGLTQPEPMFSIVQIPISSFRSTEMFQVHRNIVICDINPQNPDKLYRYEDFWAAPQIVYEFAAKDRASLEKMLRKYSDAIIDDIYKNEHRRMYKVFKGTEGIEIREAIRKQLGLTLTFSNEFEVAHPANPSSDFMWIRKETKDFGLGVLVRVLPYTSRDIFTEEVILDTLAAQMHRHVPGSADTSYMNVERRMPFYTRKVEFEGSPYCVETRGCWRTEGDFMGGPFVNYTVLSPDNKQVVMLTGYIYYPSGRIKSLSKRDLLMQAEGICYSLRFPTSADTPQ